MQQPFLLFSFTKEKFLKILVESFSSVPSSYLNRKWAVSLNSKNITESITKDLSKLKSGKAQLKNLIVTPLYLELNYNIDKSNSTAFYPTVVITYKDKHKITYAGDDKHFIDNDKHSIFYFREEKLIELDKIQSITLDGLEIFKFN